MGQLFLHLLRSICPDGGWGIFALPLDWWTRAYFAMGMGMLIQSCLTLAKTVCDLRESSRMINRIEEARTEKLLSAERA